MKSNWIKKYQFKIAALMILLIFVISIASFEIGFLLDKGKPTIYEINGQLRIRDVEAFMNGTVILDITNLGPVPVNLTEVCITGPHNLTGHISSDKPKLEVITSIKQEIPEDVSVPIMVTFSTENLDLDAGYYIGCEWTTMTGCGGCYFGPDDYFSNLENNG